MGEKETGEAREGISNLCFASLLCGGMCFRMKHVMMMTSALVVCVSVCVRACVCVCVRACVRAGVRARARARESTATCLIVEQRTRDRLCTPDRRNPRLTRLRARANTRARILTAGELEHLSYSRKRTQSLQVKLAIAAKSEARIHAILRGEDDSDQVGGGEGGPLACLPLLLFSPLSLISLR